MKNCWHNNKCTICYCCYLYNLWLLNANISSCCQRGMSLHNLPPTSFIPHTEILIYIIPSLSYYQPITDYWTGVVFRSNIITKNFVVEFWCHTNCTPSWFGLLFRLHECWALCTFEMLCFNMGDWSPKFWNSVLVSKLWSEYEDETITFCGNIRQQSPSGALPIPEEWRPHLHPCKSLS